MSERNEHESQMGDDLGVAAAFYLVLFIAAMAVAVAVVRWFIGG